MIRMSKSLVNEIITIKHEADFYYNGISGNEDPADYVRVKKIKAVKLA